MKDEEEGELRLLINNTPKVFGVSSWNIKWGNGIIGCLTGNQDDVSFSNRGRDKTDNM